MGRGVVGTAPAANSLRAAVRAVRAKDWERPARSTRAAAPSVLQTD